MAEADVTLAGVGSRKGGSKSGKPAKAALDPRRAYARRADDLLSPDLEVGFDALHGQAALDALLSRLTPVFEDAIVGLAVVSPDGRLMRVNGAMASLVGRRRGDLEGTSWRDVVHPDDVAATEARIRQAIEAGEESVDLYGRYRRTDGDVRWGLVNFAAIRDGAGEVVGWLAQVHDITHPMRLEESERASRAEIELRRVIAAAANEAHSLEDAMSTAIERVCAHTGWPVGHVYLTTVDGKLMSTSIWHFAEPGLAAIRESLRFGTFNPRLSPPGQVLVSGAPVWLPDSTAAQGFAAAATAAERGLTGWAGFPITAGSDCVGVLEFFAALPDTPHPGLLELMSDIGTQLGRVMERRRAEDERAEILIREQFLSSWFQSLLQSTEEGICGLDLDGRVSFVNRAGAEMFGYSTEELQGQSLHNLTHHTRPDGTRYQEDDCPILGSARTGTGAHSDQEVFWRRDGTPFPVEYRSHAIIDLGGDIKGTVLTFTDITDRRLEEQAVRALNQALLNTKEELERANLLKSDFLATMSHELRTPLNAIMGFAGLMQNGLAGEQSDTATDYLERITRNANVLLALINDVLDWSKIEANRMPLSPRVLDLRTIVRQVVENMQALADAKGLHLEFEDFTQEATVVAHQRAVHQVLTNLLSNAIKFTDEGGVTVQLGDHGGTTTIDVIDTGQGIAADDQAMVFEAFRQVGAHARTGTGGTGLGLAISKRLAKDMGGDLTVQSDLGLGSHFTFTVASARASAGLAHDSGQPPLPVVLWLTTDYPSTQRIRDWVEAAGLAFVGISTPDVLVKAALEMRPAVIALDLPSAVLGDMLTRVKEEPKLNPLPLIVVSEDEVPAAELQVNIWQVPRRFGPEQLQEALKAILPPRSANA